jgi:hypothetical protein
MIALITGVQRSVPFLTQENLTDVYQPNTYMLQKFSDISRKGRGKARWVHLVNYWVLNQCTRQVKEKTKPFYILQCDLVEKREVKDL